MRKYILITSMLVSGSFGADLTQISTEELANEMQKRMQTMTPQERQQYRGLNAGMGKCGDGSMGTMGTKRMMQMPKFSEYDLNQDGAITEQEFQEGHTQRMNKLAEEGRMLRNAGDAPAFSEIDTDKDGKINAEEFQAHQQDMQNQKCGSGQKGKMGKCGDGSMGMGKSDSRRMMQMPKFSDCDLNQDGAITEEEFTEARKKRMEKRAAEGRMLRNMENAPSFSDIDTNHDGKIDQAEFQAHQQERMNQNNRPGKCGR